MGSRELSCGPFTYECGSEKLKEILQLIPTTTIRFKNNSSSIKDRSSYRNGKVYVVPE